MTNDPMQALADLLVSVCVREIQASGAKNSPDRSNGAGKSRKQDSDRKNFTSRVH